MRQSFKYYLINWMIMGDELEELKYNLKVSFSRMKNDIQDNKEKISKLLEINQQLTNEIQKLHKSLDKGSDSKSELARQFNRNKKSIIQQRIIDLVQKAEYNLPDLKRIIVDQKRYCSKATFYRYINELEESKLLNTAEVNGENIVVGTNSKIQ